MSGASNITTEIIIRRIIAESDKVVAEQRKLMSESQKFDPKRRLAFVGLLGGSITVGSAILHAFGKTF